MFTVYLRRLAAAIGRAFARSPSARERRVLSTMLMLDDHLLRDIGLTRSDVIECLSSPLDQNSVRFLDARRRRNASTANPSAASDRRMAA
jgi:uncharacterized protein YjiS (DUF1127 family)